ncbi:hypothetical protein [Methanogenium sp. MK-MG]|uniref:hypothetical protein n=1 Tax=Methanogenium sp. MK-MG TaxID=2599926 RepID=UPI0013ECFE7E|nr:hypothetical protein [Methanogenium sp. MK-MG]KAF1075963.1 hypothetical protein MKMG_01593 [Methanogenium sp. MK-MG]
MKKQRHVEESKIEKHEPILVERQVARCIENEYRTLYGDPDYEVIAPMVKIGHWKIVEDENTDNGASVSPHR